MNTRAYIGAVTAVTALSVSAAAAPTKQGSAPATIQVVLDRAATYLETYASQLATVTAAEQLKFNGSRAAVTLFSDIMLVGIGTDGNWVEFRDVYQVNNQAVRNHQARLEALLGDPNSVLTKGQEIMDESAKHNAGYVSRNINVPTMALTYLMRAHQSRSSFRLLGSGDRGTTIIGFTETARPPLIHTDAGTIATSGRFWIDPTGAVMKSEVVVKNPEGGAVTHDRAIDGTITVTYQRDEALGLLVPVTMDEEYKQPTYLVGRASYSHYKSFGVVVKAGRAGGF